MKYSLACRSANVEVFKCGKCDKVFTVSAAHQKAQTRFRLTDEENAKDFIFALQEVKKSKEKRATYLCKHLVAKKLELSAATKLHIH